MKNKKIAVLATVVTLTLGSLTATAGVVDSHGAGYERVAHNQVFNFVQWLEFDNIFEDSTDAGNSYEMASDLAGHLIYKVDYDAFMTSRFAVNPV